VITSALTLSSASPLAACDIGVSAVTRSKNPFSICLRAVRQNTQHSTTVLCWFRVHSSVPPCTPPSHLHRCCLLAMSSSQASAWTSALGSTAPSPRPTLSSVDPQTLRTAMGQLRLTVQHTRSRRIAKANRTTLPSTAAQVLRAFLRKLITRSAE